MQSVFMALGAVGMITIVASMPAVANPVNLPTVYVHPQTGSDQTGDGSSDRPFRTITHALKHQRGQTLIQLAEGTYTDEQFPLVISRQTIVQGNPSNRGAEIILRGGGNFRSLFLGQQNVAIVLQDQAQLRGVTVTNPNPRGFGVWMERGNPVLTNSILKENTQDGISINGRATGIVSENLVTKNSANGITIDNLSTPEIKGNLIEENGFGISIRQNSAPQILNNQIIRNQDGVVIQAQARPLLRNNQIKNNNRTGIVVLARAIPDLGTANSLGQNTFSGNSEADIFSSSSYPVAANGNQFAQQKITGTVDLNATKLAVRFVAPTPIPSRAVSPSVPLPTTSLGGSAVVSLSGQTPPVNASISRNLPPITSAPPKGDPVNQPIVISPPRPVIVNAPPPRFRVVVPMIDTNVLNQVRSIFPDAFASNRGGRSVVQVGAYSDRRIALQRIQQLAQIGLSAQIETIER
jgi:parallel beta-helix repeat protein